MVIDSQLAPCQQSYRITLDLTVDQDFNPRQIDFRRVFNLSDYESINTHIEEFWQRALILHFTGPASGYFLVLFIKHYWNPLHYTLQGPVFVNKWFFWPAPDGPLKCSPSVRSESEERSKAPTEIQVLIRLRKGVRIGFLQTSKNWESLEVGFIIRIKVF